MHRVAFLYCHVSLCIAMATAQHWPWPWPKPNTTTTPPPSAVGAFEKGVASALGFGDISSCYKDSDTGVTDLWLAVEEYNKGGYVAKAKALANFAHGIHLVLEALEPCSQGMTDASKYKRLMTYLMDPRYYSIHNALTLALNLAEDHKQLSVFAEAWNKGDYSTAGFEMTAAALDVLGNPGIPENNGTEAVQIAIGLAKGFTSDIPFKCFTDLSVEVPAIIGGIIDIATGVKAVAGVESLFHGLEGLVPAYKQCLSDKKRIVALLREFEDFKHPVALAKKIVANMEKNDLDLSLETASAILAYKGKEWQHLGLEIGLILGKVIIIPDETFVV